MAKEPHRKTLTPPMTQWERVLEESSETDRSQVGEVEPGDEEGGGGDKGIDADTGDGGYGGDAVLAGAEEAEGQPDRPLDREIQGDPRTHEGDGYPDAARALDDHKGSLGSGADDDEEGESDLELQ
jgi:hypothetical protein